MAEGANESGRRGLLHVQTQVLCQRQPFRDREELRVRLILLGSTYFAADTKSDQMVSHIGLRHAACGRPGPFRPLPVRSTTDRYESTNGIDHVAAEFGDVAMHVIQPEGVRRVAADGSVYDVTVDSEAGSNRLATSVRLSGARLLQ